MVLVSGFNVYPREVEEVLLAHPDVAEAAVLGIPHPYTGESVKALVVLRAGARLTAEDVIAHCARSLARFKCPTAVEFVAALPHTATGKVSKGRLRELAGADALAPRRPRSAEVVLVTRAGCHLCEQAAPVVAAEAAAGRGGVRRARRRRRAEPDRAAYGDKVPVVLLDGVEHAYWQVDARALRAALLAAACDGAHRLVHAFTSA